MNSKSPIGYPGFETSSDDYLSPTFVGHKIPTRSLQNSEIYKQPQHLFLHEEFRFTVEKESVNSELGKVRSDLRMVINLIVWAHY